MWSGRSAAVSARCSAARKANDAMVEVGFNPPPVTMTEPSTMNRFATSWDRPYSFTTDVDKSWPAPRGAQQVPRGHQWIEERVDSASRLVHFGHASDHEVDHLPRVRADRVVDLWCGQTTAVGQTVIEGDGVGFLGEIVDVGIPDKGLAGSPGELVSSRAPTLLERPVLIQVEDVQDPRQRHQVQL